MRKGRKMRRTNIGITIGMATLLVLSTLGMTAGRAAADSSSPRALILGPTVDPGTGSGGKSLEQVEAESFGFVVDVLPNWDGLTAADFARYQVLILGDPKGPNATGPTSPAVYADAVSTENVWAPVVMGSGGGKVVIGTDPSDHVVGSSATTVKGTGDLERYLIAVAGAKPGATGVYIDLSDAYGAASGAPVPLLDGLSTHGPHQFAATGATGPTPCVDGVATVGILNPYLPWRFFQPLGADTELSNWRCSVHEWFTSYPSDWSPFALAIGTGVPAVTSAIDIGTPTGVPDTTRGRVWGAPYILASVDFAYANGGSSFGYQFTCTSLAPHGTTDVAGGIHSVTATLGGQSCSPNTANQTVRFRVETGPNAGESATATTDANGTATFTYADDGGVGTDFISAIYLDDQGAIQRDETTETWQSRATPTITWANPASIVYGTALSSSQLNATASVPGAFTYSPPVGTVLNAGSGQILTVSFIPSDQAHYNTVSAQTQVDVTKAPLTVTADNQSRPYRAPNPPLTYTMTGFVNGDTASVVSGSPTLATAANPSSMPGVYPIGIDEGTLTAANYSFTLVPGSLTIVRTPTNITYTGATAADFNDPATVSATLVDGGSGQPVTAAPVTFTFSGTETCSATTTATGAAICSINPHEIPGGYSLAVAYPGDGVHAPSSASTAFAVNREDTTLTMSGSGLVIATGGAATLSSTLTDPDGAAPIAGQSVTITLGTGSTAQSCRASSDSNGTATCSIDQITMAPGPQPVTSVFTGDQFFQPATATARALVFAYSSGGSFVIGDQSTAGTVTFWDAQWTKVNSLSGGSAPSSFKGFEANPGPPACAAGWTSGPGNSVSPPADPLPSYLAVVVASRVNKAGSSISGDTVHVVVVRTDPGYGASPGHSATGQVVATLC